MTQASLQESTLDSYIRLKREARSVEEVSAWFTENTEILGPLPPHSPGQVAVEVRFSIAAIPMLIVGRSSEDFLKMRVAVTIKNAELPVSPFTDVTGLSILESSTDAVYNSTFLMRFDEWSLPIAELAFEYVATDGFSGNYKPECVEVSKRVLDKHLNQHFPGLSVAWLESMRDLGLFEHSPEDESKENQNGYNKKAFIDTLFKSREKSPAFIVPDEFIL